MTANVTSEYPETSSVPVGTYNQKAEERVVVSKYGWNSFEYLNMN